MISFFLLILCELSGSSEIYQKMLALLKIIKNVKESQVLPYKMELQAASLYHQEFVLH